MEQNRASYIKSSELGTNKFNTKTVSDNLVTCERNICLIEKITHAKFGFPQT